MPWLVWFSGLGAGLQTKGRLVWFPVGAHAWVAGQVPGRGVPERQPHTDVFSLSFSLPSPLYKKLVNKIILKKKENNNTLIHLEPKGYKQIELWGCLQFYCE